MGRKITNLFSSIGAAIAHFFRGIGGHFVKTFKTWKRRFTDMDELYNYFSAEWTKHAFVLLYVLVNLFLFVEAGASFVQINFLKCLGSILYFQETLMVQEEEELLLLLVSIFCLQEVLVSC